jgi:hypothetical protein
MNIEGLVPEPFQFNPLKHHLEFIRQFVEERIASDNRTDTAVVLKELRHIGTSVMDVYSGTLGVNTILNEILLSLESQNLISELSFGEWTGKGFFDYKKILLTDGSEWALKYHNDRMRFVHMFPARESMHTFRVKANTLKSAIIYSIVIGKDFISAEDLNRARKFLGLSPVKESAEIDAIMRMIEILRT